MKKSLLLITFILNSSMFFSQQLPIEFNSSQDNFIGFDGSSFATRNDPLDGANKVGQFHNNGTNKNQGFYLDVSVDTDSFKNGRFMKKIWVLIAFISMISCKGIPKVAGSKILCRPRYFGEKDNED